MTRLYGPRHNAAWFVCSLAVTVVLERWANYLWFEQPIFKGQATNILLVFVGFGVSLLLWMILERRPRIVGWGLVFLVALGAAWLAHLVLYRAHGDAFNYTALLYIPILIMVGLKPPRLGEAWAAATAFAWTASIALVSTRLLEMVGALAIKPQPAGVIIFDTERYFLPLNDFLGIDGRWPGPFGHNGDTAMMGALLIVIAVAHWTRSSWVFLIVGAGTFAVTDGRASIGAAAAGLILMAMFTTRGRVSRIPRTWRVGIGIVLLAAGAAYMFLRPAGLTGRERIWPAFLDLWQTSPVIGVGSSGIAVSGGITEQFGHAHSLYIDELVRYGLIGFTTQFAALGIGVIILAMAAYQGRPGALGVAVTYLITGITEPRNSWIAPSATGFLFILMVLVAVASLRDDHPAGLFERQSPLAAPSR